MLWLLIILNIILIIFAIHRWLTGSWDMSGICNFIFLEFVIIGTFVFWIGVGITKIFHL